jgi:hypothetical protein
MVLRSSADKFRNHSLTGSAPAAVRQKTTGISVNRSPVISNLY